MTTSRPTSSSRTSAICAVWARPTLTACLILAVVTPAALRPTTASAQAGPPLKERFVGADKNGDGKIDREEFHRAAVESFYFRDKARKGYLVVEELKDASPEAFKAANRKGDGRLTLAGVRQRALRRLRQGRHGQGWRSDLRGDRGLRAHHRPLSRPAAKREVAAPGNDGAARGGFSPLVRLGPHSRG